MFSTLIERPIIWGENITFQRGAVVYRLYCSFNCRIRFIFVHNDAQVWVPTCLWAHTFTVTCTNIPICLVIQKVITVRIPKWYVPLNTTIKVMAEP